MKDFVKTAGHCTDEYFDLKTPVTKQYGGFQESKDCRELCKQDPSCNGYEMIIFHGNFGYCQTYSTGGLRGDEEYSDTYCYTKGTKLVTPIILVNVDIKILII